MPTETPLDRFKAVLGGAARAVAHEPEIELAFTADSPSQSGKHIKVPMPARTLPAEQVAEARGFADGFALRLRYHDTALHGRIAPHEAVARAVFESQPRKAGSPRQQLSVLLLLLPQHQIHLQPLQLHSDHRMTQHFHLLHQQE